MSDTKETLVDVVADLRERAEIHGRLKSMMWNASEIEAELTEYADRIEAAVERERVELREDEAKMLLREYAAAPDESLTPSALELKRELLRLAPAPGNAAALREALEEISARIKQEIEQPIPENDPTGGVAMCEMEGIARAALAAPPRACDVLAKEQLANDIIKAIDEGVSGWDKVSDLEKELAYAVVNATVNAAYSTAVARMMNAEEKEGGSHA